MPRISSPRSRGGILRLKLYLMVSLLLFDCLLRPLSLFLSRRFPASRGRFREGKRERGKGRRRSHDSKLLHRSPSRLSCSTDSRTNLGLKPVLRVAISSIVDETILKISWLYNAISIILLKREQRISANANFIYVLFRTVLYTSLIDFFSRNKLSSEEFSDKVQLYEGLRSLWLSSTLPPRTLSRSSFASHCPLLSPSSSRFTIEPFFSRIFFFIFDFIFVDLKVTILSALRFSFFL